MSVLRGPFRLIREKDYKNDMGGTKNVIEKN